MARPEGDPPCSQGGWGCLVTIPSLVRRTYSQHMLVLRRLRSHRLPWRFSLYSKSLMKIEVLIGGERHMMPANFSPAPRSGRSEAQASRSSNLLRQSVRCIDLNQQPSLHSVTADRLNKAIPLWALAPRARRSAARVEHGQPPLLTSATCSIALPPTSWWMQSRPHNGATAGNRSHPPADLGCTRRTSTPRHPAQYSPSRTSVLPTAARQSGCSARC